MNTRNNMVIAKGKIVTSDIKFCKYNEQTRKYDIVFNNGKQFSYNFNNVVFLKDPEVLNVSLYKVEHLGKELFDISAIYLFRHNYNAYWHICFNNGSERDYNESDLHIVKSCLSSAESQSVFNYLRQTAESVSIKSDDGTNLLSKQYEKISDFVGDDTPLAIYLNPDKYKNIKRTSSSPIFPFGCNSSQYNAVKNALENQISVIQGPPGTGKTQTILNIIANLLINGKTIQVVSNNNSATANVLEKLSSPKYNMGFIVASLGSTKNKEEFINKQSTTYPDISTWEENIDILQSNNTIKDISQRLGEVYQKQERLAIAKQQLQSLQLEKKYFDKYKTESTDETPKLKFKKSITSKKVLNLWNEIQLISETGKKISWFFKLKSVLAYGILNFYVYKNDISVLITEIQDFYYSIKEKELIHEISELQNYLQATNATQTSNDLNTKSMQLLKYTLFTKYGKKANREVFTLDDLWKRPQDFIKEYPVVLSTTFSSRSSVCKNAKFDYVIIDEASQVDVATGALALSCAKNAVIVGDSKQLPNVVTEDVAKRTDIIFDNHNINEAYRFSKNSFLESICNLISDVPQTLLREHYRCHPKIIGFCNQKFYGEQLVIMTEDKGEADTLAVYKTVKGEHARDHFSQRQIDIVVKDIMPKITVQDDEIGIIAPYNNQVNALSKSINNDEIDIATVHKFQGREKDSIILTTVDDEIGEFVDDPNLLNVAVSRAKKQLVLVVTGNEIADGSNIKDLISYIEYNNFTVTESKIYSVFDFLYKEYTESRLEYLKKSKRISEFDSENLMHKLITDILKNDEFIHLGVISHQPLNMLIRNPELLDDELCRYAMNKGTHLDFLVYNRISKQPVLAIEVDGYHYHKVGTEQNIRDQKKDKILELYGIPLLRFATNGSNEKETIIEKLRSL